MAENPPPAPGASGGEPSAPPDGSGTELILFLSFLKIAAVTVGGGYAILAAAREEFTCRRRWLSEDEFTEMVTVVVTVPGLIAVNAAIYLGWKLRRLPGALAAAFGALLPSVTVIMLIAAGVLGLLYRDAIATWVLVLVGAAIALFGLFMLIMLAVAQRGPRKIVLDVVLSVSTMIVGVLIALLVLPAVGNAVNQLCYYLFGALAIAIGAVELVMY